MMAEGVVQIKGTVQIENHPAIMNLLLRAEEYLSIEDYSQAYAYLKKARDIDARDPELVKTLDRIKKLCMDRMQKFADEFDFASAAKCGVAFLEIEPADYELRQIISSYSGTRELEIKRKNSPSRRNVPVIVYINGDAKNLIMDGKLFSIHLPLGRYEIRLVLRDDYNKRSSFIFGASPNTEETSRYVFKVAIFSGNIEITEKPKGQQ